MKIKNTLYQQVWNYIRRNSSFRVGDILMLVPISKYTLMELLSAMKKAHYIKRHSRTSTSIKTEDVEYVLCKKLGICAPILHEKKYLYDPNEKLQYSLVTGKAADDEQGNQYIRYSLLLGSEDGFLTCYKMRYKLAHPELDSAKDWYEHVKSILYRSDLLIKKLKYIKEFLAKNRRAKDFSELLKEKNIFKSKSTFSVGIIRISKQKNRTLMGEEILKRYEESVEIFEELYGSIILNKEMV